MLKTKDFWIPAFASMTAKASVSILLQEAQGLIKLLITATAFSSLRWRRLSATLLNIRAVPAMSAHPVTVFESIIKAVSSLAGYRLPVIFHIKDKKHTYRMQESDRIPVEIFFFSSDTASLNKWQEKFAEYLADPVTGRNFQIAGMGVMEERSLEKAAADAGVLQGEGEICLEFLTPFPFKVEKARHRTFITQSTFIRSLESRLSRLFGTDVRYESKNDNFSLLPYYWNYTEMRHSSKSEPGHTQYINGCAGRLYIKGAFGDLMPFLILGSELHAGAKTSNSQGYYIIHKEPQPHFRKFFPNRKVILSTIRDVLERYDNALESLSATEKFPFSEEEFSEKLYQQIITDTYEPSPNTAFLIKKKSGVERLIEQPGFRDMIVQQYLLKTISEPFDRMFEEGSIGFRKGMSRQKAIEIVQSAIKEGYQYVIESDIEDFFPSVDLRILEALLDFYIPAQDILLRNLLKKAVKNGFILNGVFHERTKGIAQGSPLSPILANLYLDSFDEQIKKWDVKMVRYADDFVILTKTKEEAENILSMTEAFLSEIGLRIKKEKTAVKHIKDGFQFLGMQFEKSEVLVDPEDDLKRLRKPLYITEPYMFLSLNGDAVDIKKERVIIETIPLRRISEIMVMEKTSFSTAFLSECTERNIPLTITLNSGYYITTIKPDSKKFYDISYEHAKKYCSLSETEILCIAKEFAIGKINNYISLFRQKYVKEQNLFIGELERVTQSMNQAGDVHQVRGFEGAAAKKIFEKLNGLIDDASFHIKKRERKNPDRINSLLNFGYYLLFSRINATVRSLGLNPYLGFLHSPEDNYESFVCDIEELFRPRINRFIIRLVNLKAITKDDFSETGRGFYLKKDAVKTFLNQFEAEMERKSSANTLSLKESIYVQTMVFKNYVLENKPLTFYAWKV